MPCPATWLLVQMRYSQSLEIQYFMLTSMIPWRTRAKALWVWEKFLLQDSTLEAQGCSEAPGFQIWSITTAWVLVFVLLSLQCFLGSVMTARAWILNLADEQQRSTPRVIGERESTVSRVAIFQDWQTASELWSIHLSPSYFRVTLTLVASKMCKKQIQTAYPD